MDISRLKQIAKDAGIAGAGGAGFPTYAKIDARAKTVLLNCAECEPLLRANRRLVALYAAEILSAFELIRTTVGAERGIVCVKKNYGEAIAALEGAIFGYAALTIKKLQSVYPSGDEVVLIYEATGTVVRPGGLPVESGVAVFNAETVYNLSQALKGRPVTDKYLTVTGAVSAPKTVLAPLGMTLAEVVAAAGGATVDSPAYLVGGPMMGAFKSPADAVTKTTNAVIVLPSDHLLVNRARQSEKTDVRRAAACCCQCRICTDLCPRRALGHPIEIHRLMNAALCKNARDTEAFVGALYCSGCGLCTAYACPQGLNPKGLAETVKRALKKSGLKPESTPLPVDPLRAYRRIPTSRLVSRLGLAPYVAAAPIDRTRLAPDRVRLPLSQHIGAPSVPCVREGDVVSWGQPVAAPAEGALSLPVHASLGGRVTAVTDRHIIIEVQA
ncbi:MAG: SLBB domain-containing protein [Clostridiales bacterium]|nr:SLBB domain-containing protein [Clostridiales bacterium]